MSNKPAHVNERPRTFSSIGVLCMWTGLPMTFGGLWLPVKKDPSKRPDRRKRFFVAKKTPIQIFQIEEFFCSNFFKKKTRFFERSRSFDDETVSMFQSGCDSIRVGAEHFAQVSCAESPPGCAADGVFNEFHTAVGHGHIDSTRVKAGGWVGDGVVHIATWPAAKAAEVHFVFVGSLDVVHHGVSRDA